MYSQNFSSFGHHISGFITLNSNYPSDVTQPLALFTGDEASLLKLSKNWGRGDRKDREENHSLVHIRQKIQLLLTSISGVEEGLGYHGRQIGGEEEHTLHNADRE